MSATQSSDVVFRPKVWSDHISAYFNRKMGLGVMALVDRTLTAAAGETANFPYFKAIGDAQEPDENEGLAVDKLDDDSFSVTVKEVAKAVGFKDKSKRVSAFKGGKRSTEQETEAQSQIARVFAEKVDKDTITTMDGSNVAALIQTSPGDTCNIRDLHKSKIIAFGDKANHAVALVMHSLDYMNMLSDTTAGFLQANATDPMYGTAGFMGRLLDMAVFVLDTVPRAADITGKKAYYHYFLKANPFGLYMAEDFEVEKDRDILQRENIITATMWYGMTSLHAKISTLDYRVGRGVFSTNVSA